MLKNWNVEVQRVMALILIGPYDIAPRHKAFLLHMDEFGKREGFVDALHWSILGSLCHIYVQHGKFKPNSWWNKSLIPLYIEYGVISEDHSFSDKFVKRVAEREMELQFLDDDVCDRA